MNGYKNVNTIMRFYNEKFKVRCVHLNVIGQNTPIKCPNYHMCYRRQAIPMEQGKIRPSVTLYPWTDHYQTWYDWLCR